MVTLSVQVDGDQIRADVGPLTAGSVSDELERTSNRGIGLRRLSTWSWTSSVTDRDGGDHRLTKTARSGNAG